MKAKRASVGEPAQEYVSLRAQLSQVGYLSRGSVQDRTGRKGGGAGYQWTRKVAGKTVTVALTPEQYAALAEAVANYRWLRTQLRKMEATSRRLIFATHVHPKRRKRLSRKVLGTN